MNKRFHTGAALALAMVLALASVTSAMARGAAPVAGWAVICTTTGGEVTLALDARGNPTVAHHPCPDCTLSALAIPGGWSVARIATVKPAAPWPLGDQVTLSAPHKGLYPARAPPHPV